MRVKSVYPVLVSVCLLVACLGFGRAKIADPAVGLYEDLSDRSTQEFMPGKVYRMGKSGICGTVEEDHILVTHVIPGSPAHGKIKKDDRIRGMQHRGMGGWGGIPNLVGVRMYRIGRDWDWHFYVTVERESLRGGKGNTVTYDLLIPPDPGNVCHYGPTGFFAKRYADRLVVEVVEKGSPSDGKLQKGDVIVAVNDHPMGLDAYQQFTEAIDKAESKQGGGKLKLTVRRGGPAADAGSSANENKGATQPSKPLNPEPLNLEPQSITLHLKVLGSYSATAPVKCEKTGALITQSADQLLKTRLASTLHADLLGLLATGEKKNIDVVRGHVHAWAAPFQDPKYSIADKGTSGYISWDWGYRNIVLTEYYLLTKDEYVLPAIRDYSRTMAAGQDQGGLWGHRMHFSGNGRAFGYGVMNQPSMSIFISLILAEKCGVKDKLVVDAIKRTHDHYDKWVGQGALPYGNHAPLENLFTNNGTSGSLAVAFALLGNKRGAQFYAGMSAAASEEILNGHGGPWWNILWSGLGANVAGPEMTTVYNKKIHWLRTVTRCWDGRHTDIMGWGSNPKPGKLSDTGSHLLNLCTGRRVLYITGKDMDKSLWLTAEKAGSTVNAGTIDTSNNKALLGLLGSSFPPVRLRAAQALAMRDADVTTEVMELLAKGTFNQRVGAIYAIQNLKIEGADDELLTIAKNEKDELWLRQLAVRALGEMNEANGYAPELLKVLVQEKPYDPYQELDLALGSALVKLYQPDPYATELDKELFYKGVVKLLDHKHDSGRGAGMTLIKNIPLEDLSPMIDKIVHLIEDKDKSYTSYAGGGRQDALEVLYRLGIKESIDLTVNTIKEPTGRAGPRIRARTKLLNSFGAEAKYAIPRIKEVLGKGADPIVKSIEESKSARKMISIEEAKQLR